MSSHCKDFIRVSLINYFLIASSKTAPEEKPEKVCYNVAILMLYNNYRLKLSMI